MRVTGCHKKHICFLFNIISWFILLLPLLAYSYERFFHSLKVGCQVDLDPEMGLCKNKVLTKARIDRTVAMKVFVWKPIKTAFCLDLNDFPLASSLCRFVLAHQNRKAKQDGDTEEIAQLNEMQKANRHCKECKSKWHCKIPSILITYTVVTLIRKAIFLNKKKCWGL